MSLVDKVEQLESVKAYDEALDTLVRGESSTEPCPYLLVTKGRLIQLAEHTTLELSDAETAFREALKVDPGYVPAMLQLAWYYLNVCDDAASAKKQFDEALSILSDDVIETIEGIARCLEEMPDGVGGALAFLDRARYVILDDKQLERIKREIKESE